LPVEFRQLAIVDPGQNPHFSMQTFVGAKQRHRRFALPTPLPDADELWRLPQAAPFDQFEPRFEGKQVVLARFEGGDEQYKRFNRAVPSSLRSRYGNLR